MTSRIAVPDTLGSLAIQSPGGYGKSTILRELRRRDEGWLAVDDAHLLTPADLTELRKRLQRNEIRLAIGLRPWPRPEGLAELVEVIRRDAPPIVLTPLTEEQTAECLNATLMVDAPVGMVRFVQAQSGGVPLYAERMAKAIGKHGFSGDVPPSAVLQFAPDLADLEPDLRRLLLASATGIELSADLLLELLSVAPERLDELLAQARSTGLMLPDNRLPPIARRAINELSPVSYRDSVRRRLVELHLRLGAPMLPLVRANFSTGYPAEALESAAHEALPTDPAHAAQLFSAAGAAGRPAIGRQAAAAALSGDLTTALGLADRLIAAPETADSADGLAAVAAALAHRGQLDRAADLYRRSGAPGAHAFAALAAAATGNPLLLEAGSAAGPPTLLESASQLMARGVHETLTGSPASALSCLVQASSLLEPAPPTAPLPDSPAALAALVALHTGELDLAESVLSHAISASLGGILLAPRHHLLRAWTHLLRGGLDAARQEAAFATAATGRAVTQVAAGGWSFLEPRDALFAAGLEVGMARRDSDVTALRRAWTRAREVFLRHPVDLFTLPPLGELAMAAARLGEYDRMLPHVLDARQLLDRLGDPPLWTAHFHWCGLHTAILLEEQDAAAEHVTALAAIDGRPFVAALATAAARWVEVLRGEVHAERVADAARELDSFGLSWDAARLAGQAAIRTTDRAAMSSLLDTARIIQGRQSGRPPGIEEDSRLSDREREVAELVLAGMTYKQIGDQLFISAKTVEHHVARMRQRLSCASRSELLARLRTLSIAVPRPRGRG